MEDIFSSVWTMLGAVFIDGAVVLLFVVAVLILWTLAGIGEQLRIQVEETRTLRDELGKGLLNLRMEIHSDLREVAMAQSKDRLRR